MTDKEIKELLSKGSSQQFSFDPSLKNEINRATMEAIQREVRKSLSSKKSIAVVVVRE